MLNILKKIKNKKGITLIEMILVLGILSVVLLMSFSVFTYGLNYFEKGNDQYSVQSDTRLVMDYIVDNTKYSTKLDLESIPTSQNLDDNQDLDYIYIEDNKLIHQKSNGSGHDRVVFASTITNYSFSSSKDDIINISIEGLKDGEDYSVSTEIMLPNIRLKDVSINNSGGAIEFSSSNEFAYQGPENEEEEDEEDEEPTISIGPQQGDLKTGESGSITFEITTTNIEDYENLNVFLDTDYTHPGLSLNSNHQVIGNKSTVIVNSTNSVPADNEYMFHVKYEGVLKSQPFEVKDAENSCTVTFDSNGGDGSYSETVLVEDGETLDSLPPNPTRNGHIFNEWNTASDGSGDEFDTSDTVNGDMTVYAQWEEITASEHKVTFLDGIGNVLKDEMVAHGDNAIAPAEPLRTGYNFNGWNKAFTNVTSDLTITAQWEAKIYTITFDKNRPKATNPSPANKTVTYDSTYGSLPTVSLKNKEFEGWYTDKNHGVKIEPGTDVSITSNITLYAHWGN